MRVIGLDSRAAALRHGASFTATGYELTAKGVRLKIDEPRKSLLMYIM